jgi:hypothetical protein
VSDYTVVAEAGEALARVLWEEMQGDPVRLSVYLYRVVEDPYVKNQPVHPGPGRRLRRAPLTLDLYFLITPLVGTPREQQMVLGKVLQVFHDRAILHGPDVGPLAAADEELRIVLNPVSLEETTRVWQALEMSYRLSVCYTVRVAIVDSTRERLTQPVVERTNDYAGA